MTDEVGTTYDLIERTIRANIDRFDTKLAIRDARIDALTEAARLLHEDDARVPTLLDKAIADLKERGEIQLLSATTRLDVQLQEMNKRNEALGLATGTALAAALQAAKELVGVQNTNFSKQIEALASFSSVQLSSLEKTVADLKDRVNIGEGSLVGRGAYTTTLLLAAGIVTSIGISLAGFLHNH